MQTEREDVPVLLVGGGSILVDRDIPLKGASKVIMPSEHWVKFIPFSHLVANIMRFAFSLASSPGHTHFSMLHAAKLGVAWGQGYF